MRYEMNISSNIVDKKQKLIKEVSLCIIRSSTFVVCFNYVRQGVDKVKQSLQG